MKSLHTLMLVSACTIGLGVPLDSWAFKIKLRLPSPRDIGRAVLKPVESAFKEAERVGERVGKELERQAGDLEEAVKETGYLVDRNARAYRDGVLSIESNVRNGRFDKAAFWQADVYRQQNKNAVRAAQDSVVIRAVAQTAATVYGGPQGAAAFASWYAYGVTGDVELAMKVGAITFATTYASAKVAGNVKYEGALFERAGDLSTVNVEAVAERALAQAAISSLAAAAGGAEGTDLHQIFVMSFATSVAGDLHTAYMGRPIDMRHADEPAVWKTGADQSCLVFSDLCTFDLSDDWSQWSQNWDAGSAMSHQACLRHPETCVISLADRTKTWRLDMREVGSRVSSVGLEMTSNQDFIASTLTGENSPFMMAVAKVPGLNGGAMLHDTWAQDFAWVAKPGVLQLTIQPAMAYGYFAAGTNLADKQLETLIEAGEDKPSPPAATQNTPAAPRLALNQRQLARTKHRLGGSWIHHRWHRR